MSTPPSFTPNPKRRRPGSDDMHVIGQEAPSGAPVPPSEGIAPQMWRISEDGTDASRPLMPPTLDQPQRDPSSLFPRRSAPTPPPSFTPGSAVAHAPGGLITDPVVLPPGDVPCSDTCVLPPGDVPCSDTCVLPQGGVSCPDTCVLRPSECAGSESACHARRDDGCSDPAVLRAWLQQRCNDPYPRCSQLRPQRNDGCSDPAVLRARLWRRCNDPYPRCS